MAWKSPRCGQACWDEINQHETERAALLTALLDMRRDRDEWRTQHENMLAIYRAELDRKPTAQDVGATRCEAVTEGAVLSALEAAGLAWEGAIRRHEGKIVPTAAVMTFARCIAALSPGVRERA